MRALPFLLLTSLLAAGETAPALTWKGSIWVSATAAERSMADGSLVFRPLDANAGSLSLDGVSLGVETGLGAGWSLQATLLGGRMGELVNQAAGESGSLAVASAQLVWTGAQDRITLGRMNTYIGVEYTDGTQDLTASRGLLATYAAPFSQVGLAWRRTFSPTWSADLFLFNGEDRVSDNNRGKTFGVGLNLADPDCADHYASLMVYRGAEQDSLGAASGTGAEGRKRDRMSLLGQWTWGPSTLQWEAEWAREPFPAAAVAGAPGPGEVTATWSGACLIYRHALGEAWAAFARAEWFQDDTGVRLNFDPAIAAAYGATVGAELRAQAYCLGVERRWNKVFARMEARHDRLNRDLAKADGRAFRSGNSATLALGASF